MDEGRWPVWRVRFQLLLRHVRSDGAVSDGWGSQQAWNVLADGDGMRAAEALRAHVIGAPVEEEGVALTPVDFRLLSVRPVSVVNLK